MPVKLQAGTFYGAPTAQMDAPGFRFTESSYDAGLSLPPHSHELAHFCLVLNGSYTERLGGKSEERRPSTLIFYPPDTVHAESSHTGGRHFLIEIEPSRFAHLRDVETFANGPVVIRAQSQLWITSRLVHEFRNRDALSLLALESLALELTISAARNGRTSKHSHPRWLIRVKDALAATFLEPPRLEELASIVNVHPVHLARAFHRFERCTISEYVRRLRIDHARRRMTTSDDSLAEIALASGFGDQSHFSRSFKRVTGLTPTQFRDLNSRC